MRSSNANEAGGSPEREVSRSVALMPVWLALRTLALGLSRTHPLRQLSFGMFVAHARERAFWLGVALYAGFAMCLRLVSGFVSTPASSIFPFSFPFSQLLP